MIKILLHVILCFIALNGLSAQVDSTNHNHTLRDYTLVAKFSPLTLIDPNTAAIQFGLEYRFLPQVSLQAEYGLGTPKLAPLSFNDDKVMDSYKYHKFRTELRYYPTLKRARDPYYFAAEVFYIPERYSRENGRVNDFLFDKASVKRDIWGGCVKYGMQYTIWKRLMVDCFVGIGVRNVFTAYTDTYALRPYSAPNPELVPANDETVYKDIVGDRWVPHFALGAKIGWAIF